MTLSATFLQISTLHREKSEFSPKRLEPSEIIEPEIKIRRNKKIGCGVQHTGYPETTNVTDNNKRSWNQQAAIACKYLSGNTLPRITLIRGKLFPDRYLLPSARLLISVTFVVLCRVGCLWVTGVFRKRAVTLVLRATITSVFPDT